MMKWLLLLLISSQALSFEKTANETYRKENNTLTVQIIRSTYPLNWTSPKSVILSVAKNKYWFPKTKSIIGHVSATINCGTNGNSKTLFTGQSSESLDGFQSYIFKGYGFSVLKRPGHSEDDTIPSLWVKGRLNTKEEMFPRFKGVLEKDNLSFLSVKLDENQCMEVFNFMHKYIELTKNDKTLAGNNYGFGVDPMSFEGSGCAPFVESLFKMAELPILAKAMDQTVYIPRSMVGNPEIGKIADWKKILFDSTNILKADKKKIKFSFPDPERLYEFGLKAFKNPETFKLKVLQKQAIGAKHSWYVLLDGRNSTKSLN